MNTKKETSYGKRIRSIQGSSADDSGTSQRSVFQHRAQLPESQGLIRKYYLLSEDGATVGGVYLWRSKEDAERLYTAEWKAFIKKKYGAEPSIVYCQSPVIVDNLTKEIIKD